MNISIWFYLQKKCRANKPATENTSLWGRVWVGRVEENMFGNQTSLKRHFNRVMTSEPCKYFTYSKYDATSLPLHTACFLLLHVASLQVFNRLSSYQYVTQSPTPLLLPGTPQTLDLLLHLVFLWMHTFS